MDKRLIDADELKKRLYKSTEWTHGEHPMILEESDIDSAPTVSAVEVVRCKDCKNLMKFKPDTIPVEKAIGHCYIRVMNSNDGQFCAVSADDYCSYGKKESEGK